MLLTETAIKAWEEEMMQQEILISGLPLPAEVGWVPLSACRSLLKFPLFLHLAADPGLPTLLPVVSAQQ